MEWNTQGTSTRSLEASPCTFPCEDSDFRDSTHRQGYMPLSSNSRDATLARKRAEYHSMVETTFARGRDGLDQLIWHQIEIDVPRTRPGVRLWMLEATQRCLERILYVWAIRHPASGYVQGINDLVTPFFQVFMSAYIGSLQYFTPRGLLIAPCRRRSRIIRPVSPSQGCYRRH